MSVTRSIIGDLLIDCLERLSYSYSHKHSFKILALYLMSDFILNKQGAKLLRDQTSPGDSTSQNKQKMFVKHNLISLSLPFVCLCFIQKSLNSKFI